jgi:hypothetical protein
MSAPVYLLIRPGAADSYERHDSQGIATIWLWRRGEIMASVEVSPGDVHRVRQFAALLLGVCESIEPTGLDVVREVPH